MRTEQFDKWLSENIYPALAGMNPVYNMTPAVEARYKELCEGKAESAFDRKLREKVYPILAWLQSCQTQ